MARAVPFKREKASEMGTDCAPQSAVRTIVAAAETISPKEVDFSPFNTSNT